MGGKIVLIGTIRIEDDKGRTVSSHKFHSVSECRNLMIRYTETFKIALEEERLFIVVETELTDKRKETN